uniref:Reverse transcriptase domain-containing protein n=1 Tax=Tanacetum cinerariifolium TaxID=118510 RepID=A0A6L2LG63_TANCI|nr:reverse transcriptase domain-containing protein [Tanacetum cinerariifolium]
MADNYTKEEMLQAPTEGYGDAIMVPDILVENFEIRTGLLSLIQANQYYSFESNNPHDHIRSFNRITSTLKFSDVPNDAIKLMLFLYSLEGAAKILYEKEPPRSILTWGDLVSKFVNHFFPPSKTTQLKNEITQSTQKFEETFGEAWERFKEMLRHCPHHRFSELHQINTFYNGLNEHDQDSLNATAGGNLLRKTPQDALIIIKNKSKVRYSRNKPVAFKINSVKTELKSDINELRNMIASYFQKDTTSTLGLGSLPSNTIVNPRGDLKPITTRSGVSYDGPPILPPTSSFLKEVELVPEVIKDTVQLSTENIQPLVAQTQVPTDEPVVSPKPKPTIPYPSRANKQKLCEKDDILTLKFVEIFRNLHFELSFVDALLHMPKFTLIFKSLLNNKEKLFDLATIPVNENCSAVILKKLPEKLGDPDKFLIPCDFPEFDECLALADLVVDYVLDPHVPLILRRPFLRIGRALIDVYGKELTLRVDDEAITFNVGQTLKYSNNDAESINQIDVINVACTFQRCMIAIFHDMIEKTMEVFMDDFSVFGDSFSSCLSHLDKMLQRCEDTNLVLNWEKCHFMIKEGIVLGHKISKSRIEVDRTKVDVIAKLPHLTFIKGVRSFLGHAMFYPRFNQDFSKITRPMTHLLEKETPFNFYKECIESFNTLKKKLTEAPILVAPDWDLPFKIMCDASDYAVVLSKTIVDTDHSALKYLLAKQDAKPRLIWWILLLQEFDVIIHDKKEAKNLAADHLSRLENPQ